jgi:Tol biopolymer transport system component
MSIVQTRGNYTPFWSADGGKLYYSSNRKGPGNFTAYAYDFKSKTEQELVFGDKKWKLIELSDVSRDGKYLLYFGRQQGDLLDNLYYYDLVEGTNHQLTNEPTFHEWGQVISHDGKWLAYTSEKDSKGMFEIYINRFPEMDQEIKISKKNGEEPKWLPDGSGVYYRNGQQWMKVPLKLDDELEIGEPELFFEGDYVNVWGPSHDVFPDGRILLLKGEEWEQPTEIDVIINALDVD